MLFAARKITPVVAIQKIIASYVTPHTSEGRVAPAKRTSFPDAMTLSLLDYSNDCVGNRRRTKYQHDTADSKPSITGLETSGPS